METTDTWGMLRAMFTAACRSRRLCELASTTTIVAPGAIAGAPSTSSDSSSYHAGFDRVPPRFTTSSGGSGR